MAQVKKFSWTNPATAVARNLDCGFDPVKVTTLDVTNGGSWMWISGMGDGYYLDVDAGTVTTSNGVTALSQSTLVGSAISAFTNANPGVITVSDAALAGFAAGDTIKVTGIAESGSGSSLNADYTIASISGNALTTGTDTSAYKVWVSGGFASRETDTNGDPVAQKNDAIYGVTLGTGVVGADDAAMVAIVEGEEPVV